MAKRKKQWTKFNRGDTKVNQKSPLVPQLKGKKNNFKKSTKNLNKVTKAQNFKGSRPRRPPPLQDRDTQKQLSQLISSGDYIPLSSSSLPTKMPEPQPGPSDSRPHAPRVVTKRFFRRSSVTGDVEMDLHITPTKRPRLEGTDDLKNFRIQVDCDSTTHADDDKSFLEAFEQKAEEVKNTQSSRENEPVVILEETVPTINVGSSDDEDDLEEGEINDDEIIEVPDDDSVIFVYEETVQKPGSTKKRHSLMRKSLKKSPKKAKKTPGQKRFIVIDGSNVAFHHSVVKKVFSVEGLRIAIEYFEQKGHETVAVVPFNRTKSRMSTNPDLLRELNLKGKVIFSPSKNIKGHILSSYDDRLILQVAEANEGAIISNDNYGDLLGQNSAWDQIIQSRVVGFTWFKNQFFIPSDPYGRDGPKLPDILNC